MRRYISGLCAIAAFAFAQHGQAQLPVQIGFGPNGLASVTYNGQQYLGYQGALNAVTLVSPQNQTFAGDLSHSEQVDPAQGRVTQTYSWGTTSTVYSASGNRLRITITTKNNSSNTIAALFFDAMGLQLPSKPQEYDGVIPILGTNQGSPTILRLTYGTGAVVFANDDVTRPLTAGFPWALNRPTSTLFPIKVNTGKEGMYPDIIPYVDRPIAPGASDTYTLSLRFGDASASTASLAGDVHQAFAAAYPSLLTWQDRRPIGSLIIGTAATGWPKNPRGWLLDPTLDVTSPQGIAAFQARLLTWADNAVAVLKGVNAQGMITWDIEGEQFPHATTYIGDPRLFATLAPEMATVADAYFKKFRDAGLRVGVCIRPQQLQVAGDGQSASQQEVSDPTQLLIDKMTWAKQRWGATLFYVDSNGDPNLPYDFKFFRRVAQALPDVLVFPEHKNTGYYGATAPYAELRQGYVSTPASARDVYPNAFTMINTADGPIDARYADLQAAVAAGDIMMFRGWFDDGNNAKIKALYSGQVVSPPTVSFTSPTNGATVSSTVTVVAQAAGVNGVAGVRLLVDNAQAGSEVTAAPYNWQWNTAALTNGPHTLSLIARDSAGQTGQATATVQVSNTVAVPPSVTITSPAAGSTVSGSVALQANATSPAGIASISFAVDGTSVSSPWDSKSVTNGIHTLTATANDTAGLSGSATGTFTVANNSAASVSVSILAPVAGATVSSNVFVKADASSRFPIFSMQLSVDGTPIAAPWWDSSAVADGTHTMTAVARDIAGGSGTSSITFTVRNKAAAPAIAIVSPASGATVNGSVVLQADATGGTGTSAISFAVDGTPVASPWDSRSAANGSHSLTATAKDSAGATAFATITINVQNTAVAVPTVAITSPAAGQTVSGSVVLQANAASAAGIATVSFAVDGSAVSSPWDSRSVTNGSHSLTATAKDSAGATAFATINFTVANIATAPDFIPPQVSITSPRNNGDAAGTVTLAANASDNVGVAGVSFFVDNILVGDAVAAPFQVALDLRTLNGGVHYVTAVARDFAGNTATNSVSFSNVERSAPACGSVGIGAFVGCYYSSLDLTQLGTTRIDAGLNFDWAWTSPDPAVPASSYSIAWSGKFAFDAASYGFELKSVGGARVYIDGKVVMDNWTGQQYADTFFPQTLTSGAHVIRVEYHRGTDAGQAKLFWWRN